MKGRTTNSKDRTAVLLHLNLYAYIKMKSPSKVDRKESPFYLVDDLDVRHKAVWDPWPVRLQVKDPKFIAAQKTILRLNSTSFDHRLDPVVLLPASSDVFGCHGGSDGFDLYSMRSPSTLPFKIFLYTARNSKLMLRKGCQSVPLETFLTTLKRRNWKSLPSDRIWKLLLADKKQLRQLRLCERVREELYRRWWLVNGFPFRELPGELRNMIIILVLDELPKVYHWWKLKTQKSTANLLPPTSLYLVSKQLMHETKSLMFRRTIFDFSYSRNMQDFTEHMTATSLATIRSVRLTMKPEELLRFWSTPVIGRFLESTHMGHEYVKDEAKPCQLYTRGFSMTHHLSSLHTFEIVFPHPHRRSHPAFIYSCQRVYCWAIFAKAYKYLKGIPNVEFGGFIKHDQKACFLQLLAQGNEETIEECVASCENEHFDKMGLKTIRYVSPGCNNLIVKQQPKSFSPTDFWIPRNGRCDCKQSCWDHFTFDYDSHGKDRGLPERAVWNGSRDYLDKRYRSISSDDLSDPRWTFTCIE